MSGENTNGRSLLNQNGDGYGGSLTYAIGEGFSVGGAITTSKRTADQNNTANARLYGNGDRATVYTGGLKYDANNIYLAAQYSQTYNATRFGTSNGNNPSTSYGFANKAQNFEVVAQYQFDFGLRPSVAYLQSKGKDISNGYGASYGDRDIVKYVDVGATYYFNKTCPPMLITKSTCWIKRLYPRCGHQHRRHRSAGSGLPVLISKDVAKGPAGPFFMPYSGVQIRRFDIRLRPFE